MIKEKIYNYELARSKGVPLAKFLTAFIPTKMGKSVEDIKMSNLDNIVKEIHKQIKAKGKFLIVGDYDVDGVTSTAIIYKALLALGVKSQIFIPDRVEDGYGLSPKVIEKLDKEGDIKDSLIITVDNGINAMEAVDLALTKGAKNVIVTDHHLPNDDTFKKSKVAHLIVNPHTNKSNLDTKDVCGAYVALLVAYNLLKDTKATRLINELKELATIGTVADVMPLEYENRTLLKGSFEYFKRGLIFNVGLKTLTFVADIKAEDIDEEKIGFYIAPMLNASGRLEEYGAIRSFTLLTEDRPMKTLASQIIDTNNRRKELVNSIVEDLEIDSEDKVNVISIPADKMKDITLNEAQGIIGLIAARVTEITKRPSLVFAREKFSARSNDDIDLHKLLTLAKDEVEDFTFGGHKGACGGHFTSPVDLKDKLKKLKRVLNGKVELIETTVYTPLIRLPQDIDADEVLKTLENLKPLQNLPPFIMEDVFAKNIRINQDRYLFYYIDTAKKDTLCAFFRYVKDTIKDTKDQVFKKMIFKVSKSNYGKTQFILDQLEV